MTKASEDDHCKMQYFLGDFDGEKFLCTYPSDEPRWLDEGFDNYAAVTFQNAKDVLLMGWGMNWQYAAQTPTEGYCGQATLARKLSLTEVLKNLDKLHTTELGVERIKRNLFLDTDDVVGWCKAKIDSVKAVITRSGKNWYSDAHAQAYEDWLGGIKGVQVPYDQCGQMGWVTPAFPKGSMLIIMSVLGAVVMPHNLFLHSEVIQSPAKYNTRSSTAPGAGQPEVPAGNFTIKGICAEPS